MRLLSDFDGVWTHPRDEARAQGEILDAQLAEFVEPAAREETKAWIAAARAAVRAAPERYGWAPGGRVSAFADEDPFAEHSALLHYVHERAAEDPVAARLRDEALARHTTLEALGGESHARGVARVAESRGPAILPDSAAAGERLLTGGVDVVVVSNSGTNKLASWLGHAGLATVVHPERRAGAIRLRGAARKFELEDGRSDPLEVGPLRVETARPHYAAILAEEEPDAVVGDVFSLDLALPLAWKRRIPAWRDVRLFWLVRDYTPARLRRTLSATNGEIEPLEGGLGAVADALLGGR